MAQCTITKWQWIATDGCGLSKEKDYCSCKIMAAMNKDVFRHI